MKYIIPIFAISLFLASCSNDEEEVKAAEESFKMKVSDLVTLHGDSSVTWDANDDFTIAVYGKLDCRADDKLTLKSDSTYEFDGGDLLCGDEDNTKMRTGVWVADTSLSTITFDKGASNEFTATILGIKDNEIELEGTWNNLRISGTFNKMN